MFCCWHGSMGFPKTPYERPFLIQFYAHRSQKSSKIENYCVSRNGHRIKFTQPNSMILVFSSAEDALINDVKTMMLFGTPGIYGTTKHIKNNSVKSWPMVLTLGCKFADVVLAHVAGIVHDLARVRREGATVIQGAAGVASLPEGLLPGIGGLTCHPPPVGFNREVRKPWGQISQKQ